MTVIDQSVPRFGHEAVADIENRVSANPSFSCRACGTNDVVSILSFGRTPLANSLIAPNKIGESEETYPLELAFCRKCALVQITETVAPEKLFREYLYFSSFSDTMLLHARELAREVISASALNANSLVLEIASNDGYLLQYYHERGIPVLGIEPAKNIAQVAEGRGIRTLPEFFSDELAKGLCAQDVQADVIHANNVLAHIPDLNGCVSGMRRVLKDTGVIIIEVPYVRDMIDGCEFDTIYHEHLSYFSLISLDRLFRRHDLFIQDVQRVDIHGGSLRIFVRKSGPNSGDTLSAAVKELLAEEFSLGMDQLQFYEAFSARVKGLRDELLVLLRSLKEKGKRIAVYGASAKGSTLLNYFGIGSDMVDFVVDRSTVKQGYFTPGTHLPIHAPEILLESMPDYVLLLTWNFLEEILDQQQVYRERGGRFVVPIPNVRVIEPINLASQS